LSDYYNEEYDIKLKYCDGVIKSIVKVNDLNLQTLNRLLDKFIDITGCKKDSVYIKVERDKDLFFIFHGIK